MQHLPLGVNFKGIPKTVGIVISTVLMHCFKKTKLMQKSMMNKQLTFR